jgi:hypothetical protein
MALAISRIKANDDGFEDWPLGLDMPPRETNAFCMSGVFGRIAIISSLEMFTRVIPPQFGVYRFGHTLDPAEKLFLVSVGFDKALEAITATIAVSAVLLELHERFAQRQRAEQQFLLEPRRRVELPPT